MINRIGQIWITSSNNIFVVIDCPSKPYGIHYVKHPIAWLLNHFPTPHSEDVMEDVYLSWEESSMLRIL
jgi:hypothetical protein